MTIHTLIGAIVTDLADAGCETSPAAIEATMRADHPDTLAEFADNLVGKAIRRIARDVLTARTRTTQGAFDGMDLPAWFTVDRGGEFVYVPLKSATLADHDADVAVKQRNADAAVEELRYAQRRGLQLRLADGATDTTLVLDAVEALAHLQVA